jgi:hypothetical protein
MNSFLKNNWLSAAALMLIASLAIWSCVKTEFDEPPAGGVAVDIQANTTIKELKKLHVTPDALDKIKDDLIIGGEVVMDDRSGNFYKTLIIQDATGGIEVQFNDGYLFNSMPIGRYIYIRCKDLILTDYNGLPQLSGSILVENGVPSAVGLTAAQVRQKVVKGEYKSPKLTPKKITVNDLNTDLLNTLVELDGMQFTQCDAGKSYADVVSKNSINRLMEDCNGLQLILRSSGYSDFASKLTPTGNGKIVGVLGVFGSDYQLFIRNVDDVNMTGARCGSNGSGTATPINISEIRSLFTGTITSAPAGKKIKGIVLSDRGNKNLNSRNIYLQDGTAGIVVRFEADHCFEQGDEIEVNVSNVEVSEFNKLLQLNNVPLANASIISSGNTPTPRVATIAEINTNYNAWESTLVKVSNVTLSGGSTFSGSRTATDASGNIVLFTSSAALFSLSPLPTAPVTITAIVSDFNGKQLLLRNLNDVQ